MYDRRVLSTKYLHQRTINSNIKSVICRSESPNNETTEFHARKLENLDEPQTATRNFNFQANTFASNNNDKAVAFRATRFNQRDKHLSK